MFNITYINCFIIRRAFESNLHLLIKLCVRLITLKMFIKDFISSCKKLNITILEWYGIILYIFTQV